MDINVRVELNASPALTALVEMIIGAKAAQAAAPSVEPAPIAEAPAPAETPAVETPATEAPAAPKRSRAKKAEAPAETPAAKAEEPATAEAPAAPAEPEQPAPSEAVTAPVTLTPGEAVRAASERVAEGKTPDPLPFEAPEAPITIQVLRKKANELCMLNQDNKTKVFDILHAHGVQSLPQLRDDQFSSVWSALNQIA